ncbi:conserved hypothetical protein [Burkholderia pseudomallei MSHR346]|nr:conserved hypothetical protein [Burkholderia pseudomallei MSHR346]
MRGRAADRRVARRARLRARVAQPGEARRRVGFGFGFGFGRRHDPPDEQALSAERHADSNGSIEPRRLPAREMHRTARAPAVRGERERPRAPPRAHLACGGAPRARRRSLTCVNPCLQLACRLATLVCIARRARRGKTCRIARTAFQPP